MRRTLCRFRYIFTLFLSSSLCSQWVLLRLSRWGSSHQCDSSTSTFECYFERINPCNLSIDEIMKAPVVSNGRLCIISKQPSISYETFIFNAGQGIDTYPFRGARVVRLAGLPAHGPCSKFPVFNLLFFSKSYFESPSGLCGDNWYSHPEFFDGLFIGERGFDAAVKPDGSVDTSKSDAFDKSLEDLVHFASIRSPVKLFWISQFLRYLLRPRMWFSELVRKEASNRLFTVKCWNGKAREGLSRACDYEESIKSNSSLCCAHLADSIPRPYVSMHVRYGFKCKHIGHFDTIFI